MVLVLGFIVEGMSFVLNITPRILLFHRYLSPPFSCFLKYVLNTMKDLDGCDHLPTINPRPSWSSWFVVVVGWGNVLSQTHKPSEKVTNFIFAIFS